MAIEYLPNNLGDFIHKHREYIGSTPFIKKVAFQLLCGLNHIHKSGLIHRDLKPNNVLINDNLDVKICDFGLSTLKY